MPTKCAQFIDPFLAAGEKGLPNPDLFDLVSSALRIHTIRVDIGNCGHRPRCGICSTERSANKLASARSATNSSLTTTTWFQTIGIQREWVERGETTILTISRQYIGGVTMRRDLREWMADGRLAALGRERVATAPAFNNLRITKPARKHLSAQMKTGSLGVSEVDASGTVTAHSRMNTKAAPVL